MAPPKPSDPDEPSGFLSDDADEPTQGAKSGKAAKAAKDSKTKKAPGPTGAGSRRARLAGLEAQRKADARRRTVILLVLCIVLAAGVLAYPVYLFVDDAVQRGKTLGDLGVSASAASCAAPVENAAKGNQDHVADGTDVTYERLPPDSGPHYNTPATFSRKFYTPEDRPAVETLVHNLEHGYTVVWYRAEMPADQIDTLDNIAKTFSSDPEQYNAGKFIAAPWQTSDGGAFPAGQNVVMTRWYADPTNPADANAQKGVRQQCGAVSGEAIGDFMKKYPQSDSPEPNGA